ncbi:unnamed protein product (macronuclear) [Paramecium tetraurelia]|uniref:Uncharacterized protein n=1 Tax=Paramecium tetraurelia TaxID=5888 RepID=A0CKP9_PARTE|nr:uncharacterized protein GSPATT00001080001 [Paramecium tetraurelia]CAK71366.1 unnamed protein product [Paramecium tetraurelia]|eukprot:XP_001438763.1 hypothetical protein (macronuclear) [Paramecium tetraurelia strain d4-2]
MSQRDLSNLISINPNDPQQYQDLLAYYRSKLGEFEKERFEWLTKLEEIKIQYEDKHQQEWELLKRKQEIKELQQTNSRIQLMLFEERQARLKLQKENDALKVRELEDKKKIAELMAMIEPIEEQVVLQKDLRPEVTTKYTGDTLAVREKQGNVKMHNINQGRSILKTVYMPNEQLNAYQLENENLKKQVENAEIMLTQQFAALREELRAKEVETNLRIKEDQQKLDQLVQKIQKLEKQNVELVKGKTYEYNELQIVMHKNKNFRIRRDKCKRIWEVAKLKNKKLKMELDQIQKKYNIENKTALELLEKKSDEYNKKFRSQIKSKDEQLSIIKEQYEQVQNIYINKIQQLEENLSKLIEKYQQLEKRRSLEIEGFKNDIKILTKKVKDCEKSQVDKQNENKSPEELAKYQEEAQQMKQQLAKETGIIYSSGKKNNANNQQQTIKVKGNQQRGASKTMKQSNKQTKKGFNNQNQTDQKEEDDASESVPMHELEDLQRQLDELQYQMDKAKKQ